jgi:hypothetical protein
MGQTVGCTGATAGAGEAGAALGSAVLQGPLWSRPEDLCYDTGTLDAVLAVTVRPYAVCCIGVVVDWLGGREQRHFISRSLSRDGEPSLVREDSIE